MIRCVHDLIVSKLKNKNQLIEIPHSEWEHLRDMYRRDWPKHHVGYYTLDNFIRWLKIEPHIRALKCYSLNGDWNDGTFLVVDRYQLFLNSLNPSNDRLEMALGLLDWTYGYKVSSFLERHRSAVVNVVTNKNLKIEYDSLTVLYYLPKEEVENMEMSIPDDIEVKLMSEEHASIADELWPNRHDGSLFFLKRLIKWNPNIGIFKKDTNELIAWCFRLQAGPLGALQVKSSYKRRGLGILATKAMCKQLAAMGHDIFALVNDTNIPSRAMFEKLKFQNIDTCFWLRTYPTIPFTWNDD